MGLLNFTTIIDKMKSEKETLRSIIEQIAGLAFYSGKRYDLICVLGSIVTRINLLIKRLEEQDQHQNF